MRARPRSLAPAISPLSRYSCGHQVYSTSVEFLYAWADVKPVSPQEPPWTTQDAPPHTAIVVSKRDHASRPKQGELHRSTICCAAARSLAAARSSSSAGRPASGSRPCWRPRGRRRPTCSVLAARGIESEAQLPYAGLHQLLRPVLGPIDALAAPQARALRGALGLEEGASDEWFLVSLAVLSLLAEAAEARPLVCLVDDAHWLDDASAESLVFAGRRLHAEGVVMLFAAREGGERSFAAPGFEELDARRPRARGGRGPARAPRAGGALGRRPPTRLISGTGATRSRCSSFLGAQRSAARGRRAVSEPLPVSARLERAFLERARRLPDAAQTLLLSPPPTRAASSTTVLDAAARLGRRRRGARRGRAGRAHPRPRVAARAPPPADPLGRLPRRAALPSPGGPPRARAPSSSATTRPTAAPGTAPRPASSPTPGVVDGARERGRGARGAQRLRRRLAGLRARRRARADERRRVRLLTAAAENAWFAGRSRRALALLRRARGRAASPAVRAETTAGGVIELTSGSRPTRARSCSRRAGLAAATASAASTCSPRQLGRGYSPRPPT